MFFFFKYALLFVTGGRWRHKTGWSLRGDVVWGWLLTVAAAVVGTVVAAGETAKQKYEEMLNTKQKAKETSQQTERSRSTTSPKTMLCLTHSDFRPHLKMTSKSLQLSHIKFPSHWRKYKTEIKTIWDLNLSVLNVSYLLWYQTRQCFKRIIIVSENSENVDLMCTLIQIQDVKVNMDIFFINLTWQSKTKVNMVADKMTHIQVTTIHWHTSYFLQWKALFFMVETRADCLMSLQFCDSGTLWLIEDLWMKTALCTNTFNCSREL